MAARGRASQKKPVVLLEKKGGASATREAKITRSRARTEKERGLSPLGFRTPNHVSKNAERGHAPAAALRQRQPRGDGDNGRKGVAPQIVQPEADQEALCNRSLAVRYESVYVCLLPARQGRDREGASCPPAPPRLFATTPQRKNEGTQAAGGRISVASKRSPLGRWCFVCPDGY